jgi:uncharacterized membrane protein
MNRRNARGTTTAVFRIVCIFVLFATPAWARSWRISDFHSTIAIEQDGTTLVSERISLVFIGQFQGIHRRIPINYPGPERSNYRLFIHVVGVKDENGQPLRYENHVQGDYRVLTIYIPGAVDTSKTVEITYQMRNAVRYFPQYDEFYWNVTGNDWPVPIDHASALVIFPDKAAGSLRAQAFTGVYASTQHDATVDIKGHDVDVETSNPLPMRGGLTVDVYIPQGILENPGPFTRLGWFIGSNPVVLAPVVSFVVMFLLWYLVGRDPDPGMSVAPMYSPPANMTPAEVGTLVDDSVDARDMMSTLIDLAVKGYVKIEETQTGTIFHHKDYIFHRLKPVAEWGSLAPHERAMLSKIFGADLQTRQLSDLKNDFYTVVPMIKSDIMSQLKEKGMYTVDPDSAHAYWIVGILIVVAVVLLAQYVGHWTVFDSGVVAVISLAISALIIFLFGRVMTAKSLQGARTWVAIKGFQEFLSRVEADRLARMPADTFEKFLPYAMALGVEQRWAKAFAGIQQTPPAWYVGPSYPGVWNPIMFTNSIGTMTSIAHNTFVSAPRASSTGSGFSSGGGFSGGGFSGGGFGGGGGDAF